MNSFAASSDTSEKLESHLKLLKEEYTKLQRNYAELERKYSRAAAASGDKDLGEFSSFVSRLAMTVATLYGRKTYSDITIRFSDKTIPAHKFVLNARSEEWREEVLADMEELGTNYSKECIKMTILAISNGLLILKFRWFFRLERS